MKTSKLIASALLAMVVLLTMLPLGQMERSAAQEPPAVEFPIETEPTTEAYPAVSGNLVVWLEECHSIHRYDLYTKEKSLLVSAESGRGITALALYDKTLVWIEKDIDLPALYHIYKMDIMNRSKLLLWSTSRITRHIDIWGDIIIWESRVGIRNTIYGYVRVVFSSKLRYNSCIEVGGG